MSHYAWWFFFCVILLSAKLLFPFVCLFRVVLNMATLLIVTAGRLNFRFC